jgi:hypothetical protein
MMNRAFLAGNMLFISQQCMTLHDPYLPSRPERVLHCAKQATAPENKKVEREPQLELARK